MVVVDLPSPRGVGVDARDDDVVALAALRLEFLAHLLRHLGLVVAVRLVVGIGQAARRGDRPDLDHARGLRHVDVSGHRGLQVRELADGLAPRGDDGVRHRSSYSSERDWCWFLRWIPLRKGSNHARAYERTGHMRSASDRTFKLQTG